MILQYTGPLNSGGAPFHPTDLASAVAIWEADVNVEELDTTFPEDGDEVYKWIDQTSNAYNADRNTSGPLWEETTGINSGPSLIWDIGNNDYLVVTGSDSSPLLSSTGDWHMFFVFAYNTGDTTSTYIMSQGNPGTANNGHFQILHRYTSNGGGTFRTGVSFESDGTSADMVYNVDITGGGYSGGDALMEVKRVTVASTSTITTIVDGTSGSSTTDSTHALEQDGFVIGARANTWGTSYDSPWQGTIAAVYVFNAEITGTDYTNLTTYITNKWGV